MILAIGAILHHVAERGALAEAERASRAVYESVLEAAAAGVRTPDLGGHSTTSEFTDEVIARVRTKVEIWATLGPRI
jgi:isocitrate/isopropylmalate dehydrogenase